MNDTTATPDMLDQTPAVGAATTPSIRPRVYRRQYLVDRRRQLRTVVLTAGVTIFLLAIVNIAFGVMRASQSMVLSAAAPQLRPILEQQDSSFATTLLVISFIFVAGVAIITVAETHRTAGAIYAMKQRLDRVRDGGLHVTLDLRKRDTLRDLMEPFNEMVASLRDRVLADADDLDRLADQASSATADPAALAARLRELADRKRERAS
ncbi:MAG: methyl-accepting chemotaxis protein [Candidatus Sulfomarinibacteraceae bacterium]